MKIKIFDKINKIKSNSSKIFEKSKGIGAKDEQDEFWEVFQMGGQRADYTNAFSGPWWTDKTFNPKYNIIITDKYKCPSFANSKITDFDEKMTSKGLMLSLRVYSNCFKNSAVTKITLDCMHIAYGDSVFTNCADLKQVTIKNHNIPNPVTLSTEGGIYLNNSFHGCPKLEIVHWDGEICGGVNVDLQECPLLTHDSLMEIINALQEAAGSYIYLQLGEVNRAKLTEEELDIAIQKGWNIS